ncbi:MAG TPA: histidine--tRNA ligase [Verrucomicrobiae bacterium]|nr:histidine--tRNA ligase [Verrucomicrobiae bacterium]
MAGLPTQPYKGTRDYYPEDKRIQNYIFSTWRKVVESFGYEEHGAPLLEPLDIYAAKTGQEIVGEQTYQFTDRGGRTVAIRPEMTPTVSRMIAARHQEIAMPARWYSIANYMRYERPQRGREREFWQLNADIFGVASVRADAEIIILADRLMKAFGATKKMYTIKINDRKLINYMMADYLELDVVQAQLMMKLFDRRGKISPEEFRDRAAEIFEAHRATTGLRKIAALVSAKTMAELPEAIRNCDAIKEIQSLFTLLNESGVKNATFDISLMRGFDYYTGIVFEVFDNHPDNNRSMFGGGRYDGMTSLFGAPPIPTVGMAPGYTTTELFLRSHDLLPELDSTTEVYLIVLDGKTNEALQLANKLREEGVTTEVDITGRNLDKQIKTVVKKRIPFMVFVGSKEAEEELYTFKDVKTTKEQRLGFERVVSVVKDRRRKVSDELDEFFA